MYPSLRTTPVAGIRFTEHLKQLILHLGLYKPPLATLGGLASLPSATHVPEKNLTDELVEEIKTECRFIGEPVEIPLTPVLAAPVAPSSDAMLSTKRTYRPAAMRRLNRPHRRVQCNSITRTQSVLWPQARGKPTGRAWQQFTKKTRPPIICLSR